MAQKQSTPHAAPRAGMATGTGGGSLWRFILPCVVLPLMLGVLAAWTMAKDGDAVSRHAAAWRAPVTGLPRTSGEHVFAADTEAVIRQALSDMAGLPYEEFLAERSRNEAFPLPEHVWGRSAAAQAPTSFPLTLRPYAPSPAQSGIPPGQSGAQPGMPPGIPSATNARLVIVVDDMGESMADVSSLLSLPYPVTFAVWPDSSYARETAEAAHRAGREVIVHQPMEPMDYPAMRPGPRALLLRTSPTDAAAILRRSLSRVPHAAGLNNHMGSRYTREKTALGPVLDVLGRNGLFVLDSLTHPASLLYREARAANIPALRRDIFLDAEPGTHFVLTQLARAEHIANVTGQAVAIGHPYPETLKALKTWAGTRNGAVRVVTLGELLR